jgi:hypothetical protein
MEASLRVWRRYCTTVGYVATGVVVVAFIWLFSDFLFRAPEFFPSWDQRNFYNSTREALSKLQSIFAGDPNSWTLSGWGLGSQYNILFGIPLAPIIASFGDSWYVYGMAIAVVYGTAAILFVGAIAMVLLAGYRPLVVYVAFTATALIAVTRSAGWYSTVFYYPDIGDAFVFAIWIGGAIVLLRHPSWRWTGVLVLQTAAVLIFRRYLLFVWGAVGIGLAISSAIECWVHCRKSNPQQKRSILRADLSKIGYLAASAVIPLAILAILPRTFLREMISLAVNGAYSDYIINSDSIVDEMLAVMGIIPIFLSVAGYLSAAIVFRRRRFEILGLGLGAVLTVLSWVTIIRQGGAQYWIIPGVLFLPLGIGLGLAALAQRLSGRKLAAALGTAFLLFLVSAGRLVDGAASNIMDVTDLSGSHLQQGRVSKLSFHRDMAAPFKEVFARLQIAGPLPRTVVVVASSFIFNEAVVHSAADALLGDGAKSYFFEWVPVIDSGDRLLVTEIIDADFVLVGNPLQTHLPRGFEGLRAVRDMFLKHDGAALGFERLGEPVAFPGYSVSVYRRIRESGEQGALSMIEALKSAVPVRGYGQPSWIEIGRPRRGQGVKAPHNDTIVAQNRIARDGWPARYASYDTMPAGLVELGGVGKTTCPHGAVLTLRVMTQDHRKSEAAATTVLAYDVSPQPFSLAVRAPLPGFHLEMEINPPSSEVACAVTLERLKLHSEQTIP